MVLGGWAGGTQGASFSPPQPCVTLSISDRFVSFLLFFFSAVGLALTWVTPKLIKWVPLAHSTLCKAAASPGIHHAVCAELHLVFTC